METQQTSTPQETEQRPTYYSGTLTGPGFHLSVELIDEAHLELFEMAVSIIRLDMEKSTPNA